VAVPVRVTGVVHRGKSGLPDIEAIDLNASYYTPGLFCGVDYVITSASVRGRYEADPARFGAALRFYDLLRRDAERVAAYRSTWLVSGPTIEIYRVTPRCRASFRSAPLAADWWVSWSRHDRTPTGEGSSPAEREIYERYFREFAKELFYCTLWRGDTLTAERLAAAGVRANQGDVDNAIGYGICLGARGSWKESRSVIEHALEANPAERSMLLLALARVEGRLGDTARQERCLVEIASREPDGSPLRQQAALELARIKVRARTAPVPSQLAGS